MARYRIQLYNVPDQHLYAPLPHRLLHTVRNSSWSIRVALAAVGVGMGLIINLVVHL